MAADPISNPISDLVSDPTSLSPRTARRKLWRAVLFVAGSAAFSGVALALWNRRELTHIQQSTPPTEPPAEIPDEEIY